MEIFNPTCTVLNVPRAKYNDGETQSHPTSLGEDLSSPHAT